MYCTHIALCLFQCHRQEFEAAEEASRVEAQERDARLGAERERLVLAPKNHAAGWPADANWTKAEKGNADGSAGATVNGTTDIINNGSTAGNANGTAVEKTSGTTVDVDVPAAERKAGEVELDGGGGGSRGALSEEKTGAVVEGSAFSRLTAAAAAESTNASLSSLSSYAAAAAAEAAVANGSAVGRAESGQGPAATPLSGTEEGPTSGGDGGVSGGETANGSVVASKKNDSSSSAAAAAAAGKATPKVSWVDGTRHTVPCLVRTTPTVSNPP